MLKRWMYRREAKALLVTDYEYDFKNWQQAVFKQICSETFERGLPPGDAAGAYMDAVCQALLRPLSSNSVPFIQRVSVQMIAAVTNRRASMENFPRATRLLLFSQGASPEKFREINDLVEMHLKSVLASVKHGIPIGGESGVGLLFEMAAERGLISRRVASTWVRAS